MTSTAPALLSIEDLHVGYGKSMVLQGVSLQVHAGEIVALLGRNGSGRSTLAQAIMGLLPAQGRMTWHGQSLLGLPPYAIARLGVGYVPEHREVFPHLTVQQNLLLGQKPGQRPRQSPGGFDEAQAYAWFDALRARAHTAAGVLSGGEQQMLSLARTLMGRPQLLLADEPTEGLAPHMCQQVAAGLLRLKQQGVAVLLIEQKRSIALNIADRVVVLGRGQVVYHGSPADLSTQPRIQQEWLAI